MVKKSQTQTKYFGRSFRPSSGV